jgi:D-alanyl-D-alanine carboxypeptidase/D-alanyl-D-alanine-endopeptidase (penicillin-binding protein 4)
MGCLLLPMISLGSDTNPLKQLEQLEQTSLLALDSRGNRIASIAQNQTRIPASTLKILTAWLAITHWGLESRFFTDFYLVNNRFLWVKGYGDPFLVSEEIDLIALALKKTGLKQIQGLGLDEQFFAANIQIDGQSSSTNPYDAPLAALSANFNTLYLQRTPSGIQSAEPQTPLTAIGRTLGKSMQGKKTRFNIQDRRLSSRYFGELLASKMNSHGIKTFGDIYTDKLPSNAKLLYRHYNSHPLSDVLKAMLQYSTNFIANQLFLMLGADYYGAPATLEKAQRFANLQVKTHLGWNDVYIQEGAGLSRKNKISATQFMELLHQFQPYRKLLASKIRGIYGKTGTLNGVSCYAGFIESPSGPAPFALFINSPVPYNYRMRVARALQRRLLND